MASVDDFSALIGPPTKQPPIVDWKSLESEVGLVFPADYKELMSRYSEMVIDDFLGLRIPHPGLYSERSQRENALSVLEDLIFDDEDELTYIDERGNCYTGPILSIYPEVGGLYLWGSTNNGDYCLWLTDQDPGNWIVYITRGDIWWNFPGPLLDFLVGLLSGTVRCPLFPNGGLSRTFKEYGRGDR
ncbi:hypothetical protein ACFHYQ_18190 [Sphaerimonospora cavernae]|uniref:SUKH superfamily protein n=1 Tax=Sphaerimonospora cavernae TaxID=1740611 RepID=A0ABV6U734_9ACTN